MAKFNLKADPTFATKVAFPVAGGDSVDVLCTFRHRTKTELDEFIKSRDGRTDVQTFMEMVLGWDLADDLNEANVTVLLEHHIGVALATYRRYIDELTVHRRGN